MRRLARGALEALHLSAEAGSVLAMDSDCGSFMRSLADGASGLAKPSLRSLPVALGALWHHEMAALKSACPTTGLALASHRLSAETRHLGVATRPKGPLYCRDLALLRPSGKAKSLHPDRFRGRRQGRFSAVNCNIDGHGSQLSSWEPPEMTCYDSLRIGSIRPRRPAADCAKLPGSGRICRENESSFSDHIGSHNRAAAGLFGRHRVGRPQLKVRAGSENRC